MQVQLLEYVEDIAESWGCARISGDIWAQLPGGSSGHFRQHTIGSMGLGRNHRIGSCCKKSQRNTMEEGFGSLAFRNVFRTIIL